MDESREEQKINVAKNGYEKIASELVVANKELAFQNAEKEKRAAELLIANSELTFQNSEKEKRAAELIIANKELAFQNIEKEKRAAELLIANSELTFQNSEKEKRAAELIIANEELAFQNIEKEKRAAELLIANIELTFQNSEKEKRAAELIIANAELAFQNLEKEKRAAELLIANTELTFQNSEKEKRAYELSVANQDLISFTYVSSHDLQEPLRKIQNFVARISTEESKNLSETGRAYFIRISKIAQRMQELIDDLLTYSRTKSTEHKLLEVDLNALVKDVLLDFEEMSKNSQAIITVGSLGTGQIIPFQVRQLFLNLIGNSFKFSKKDSPTEIKITSKVALGVTFKIEALDADINYLNISVLDKGIGFDPQYNARIFEVFQRLHSFEEYHGTGIGLAICKRIMENHKGLITANGTLGEGTQIDLYFPIEQ